MLEHPGCQKAQGGVETGHWEKAVCLLHVHEPLHLASHCLGNIPLDGAGLDVKLREVVPVQASLPAVMPPLWSWKGHIQ